MKSIDAAMVAFATLVAVGAQAQNRPAGVAPLPQFGIQQQQQQMQQQNQAAMQGINQENAQSQQRLSTAGQRNQTLLDNQVPAQPRQTYSFGSPPEPTVR